MGILSYRHISLDDKLSKIYYGGAIDQRVTK